MNVSLVHFVEDANGNVTEVVNMSNDGQAEVSTTTMERLKVQTLKQRVFLLSQLYGWQMISLLYRQ